MSEEKRTPISIYLTPRAAMILRQYNTGSGYGSKSRTVEEIILAFDAINENMKIIAGALTKASSDQNISPDAVVFTLTTLLTSTLNSLSRLNKSTL